jgi:hypothetical protein
VCLRVHVCDTCVAPDNESAPALAQLDAVLREAFTTRGRVVFRPAEVVSLAQGVLRYARVHTSPMRVQFADRNAVAIRAT